VALLTSFLFSLAGILSFGCDGIKNLYCFLIEMAAGFDYFFSLDDDRIS
jgi:hypothetical protein